MVRFTVLGAALRCGATANFNSTMVRFTVCRCLLLGACKLISIPRWSDLQTGVTITGNELKLFQFHDGPIYRQFLLRQEIMPMKISIPRWSDLQYLGTLRGVSLFHFNSTMVRFTVWSYAWRNCKVAFQFHDGPIYSPLHPIVPCLSSVFQFHDGPIYR